MPFLQGIVGHSRDAVLYEVTWVIVEGTRPVAVKVVANTLDRNDEVF